MLSPLLLVFAYAAHRQEPPPTAAGLISKMLQHYASASSMAATIRTTQTAADKSVVTETSLAFERPSKIRLDQRQVGTTLRRKGLLVSDGTTVCYSKPDYLAKEEPYLYEPVKNPKLPDSEPRKMEELYDLAASAMPDRSPILDILAGGAEDRKYFAGQLASFDLKGKETVNEKSVNVIEGSWRETAGNRPSGQFRICLTDEGEIVRYVLVQSFAPPASTSRPGRPQVGGDPVTVTTVWDATVTLNATFKPDTFALKE